MYRGDLFGQGHRLGARPRSSKVVVMKLGAVCLCMLSIPFVAGAQLRPNATSYYDDSFNGVIAQFVDGGSWKSIVTLINLDTSEGSFTLHFYANDGSPLTIQTSAGTGTSVTGLIPAAVPA